MDASPEYRAVCCRMNTLRAFFRHLMLFLLMNGSLLVLNLLLDAGHLWAIWPLGIWAGLLAAHGIVALRRERRLCLAGRAAGKGEVGAAERLRS